MSDLDYNFPKKNKKYAEIEESEVFENDKIIQDENDTDLNDLSEESSKSSFFDNVDVTLLKEIGIIFGVVVFFLGTIILFSFASRGTWKNGLSNSIQACLEQNFPGEYTIADECKIQSGFATSAIAFYLESKTQSKYKCAVLINITTLYGQTPALFLITQNGNSTFVDFLNMPRGFSEIASASSMKSVIYYWQKRIPNIIDLSSTGAL